MAKRTLTPEALLERFPPPIAGLAEELRGLVKQLQPTLNEAVYPGWQAFGYRHSGAGYVGGIFLSDNAVKLLFEHGHLIPDPDGVLEGETKQTRHITFLPGDSFPDKQVALLLEAAIEVGIGIKAAKR